jgi:hypothetical protein
LDYFGRILFNFPATLQADLLNYRLPVIATFAPPPSSPLLPPSVTFLTKGAGGGRGQGSALKTRFWTLDKNGHNASD